MFIPYSRVPPGWVSLDWTPDARRLKPIHAQKFLIEIKVVCWKKYVITHNPKLIISRHLSLKLYFDIYVYLSILQSFRVSDSFIYF